MSQPTAQRNFQAAWHLLVEEGWAVADFRTHEGGEDWRREMRDRARKGKRTIRTGRADQKPLRVWAVLTDARATSTRGLSAEDMA